MIIAMNSEITPTKVRIGNGITKNHRACPGRHDVTLGDHRRKETMLRFLGIALDGLFSLLRAVVTLPARILTGGRA